MDYLFPNSVILQLRCLVFSFYEKTYQKNSFRMVELGLYAWGRKHH